MTPCFLIPISVGIISALLGYLLGKMVTGGNQLNLKSKLDVCSSENEQLNYRIYLLEKEIEALKPKSKTAQDFTSEVVIAFDAQLAESVFGQKITENDLTIIEGIGPKIEELYHAAGIRTWKDLGETPVQTLQEILNEAGSNITMHNPETWAKQAVMAYLGKWQDLKEYQESLDAGRE
jgi:predicted flap endonuclease-1-like 5' DNA nuclease